MFSYATIYVGNKSTWNVSKVIYFRSKFYKHMLLTKIFLNGICPGHVILLVCFYYASAFNKNLCQWGNRISSSENVQYIFEYTNCPNKNSPAFDRNRITNMGHDSV
jgi:Mycoplasma protein of unknown function, DUF285